MQRNIDRLSINRYLFIGLAVLVLGTFLVSPALAKSPYAKPNNTWISISGTVKNVNPNTFILDYGKGTITVEMDDGDRDADAYKLLVGDKVTVNGMIDDGFFQKRTIEASSVYVEKLGAVFFASAADENDVLVTLTPPLVVGQYTVQGTVQSVGKDDFTLDTGARKLTVDVGKMPFNPLDDTGYLKIEPNDFVRVGGSMEYDLFEGRKLEADSIVELID